MLTVDEKLWGSNEVSNGDRSIQDDLNRRQVCAAVTKCTREADNWIRSGTVIGSLKSRIHFD